MTFAFSQRSLNNLKNVHPDLVKVVTMALALSPLDLIHVWPMLPSPDATNLSSANSVCGSGSCVSARVIPNGHDFGWRQFCAAILYASGLAKLPHHVGRILCVCAKKQMRRIHAMPHITCVKDQQPLRNWTVRQFPREAMG